MGRMGEFQTSPEDVNPGQESPLTARTEGSR